tara:strand:+ start:19162 stop:24882 length:5721 start_codon:yes stop_codon:yes gene_type:complete
MSKCYNVNLPEYKALREEFPNESAVNNVISRWQSLTKEDTFPTTEEALQMMEDSKVALSLKQKNFKEAVLTNLSRLKIASVSNELGGDYFINNTAPNAREGSPEFLQYNYKRALRYLSQNNIPQGSVTLVRTPKSYRVVVNEDLFSLNDMLPENRKAYGTHTIKVLGHLQRMFPELRMNVVSVKQAEAYYKKLDPGTKNKVNFANINSFYYDGQVVLIQGRVTNETAIEEVLHAFTDSLALDNPELFKSLVEEAKKSFPILKQQIDEAYNTKNGRFTDYQRDLELITQALTRHFDNDYETKPTKTFLGKVKEMLEWFMSVIQDLHDYITVNGDIKLPTSAIKSTANLSDVAKLLNTSNVIFDLKVSNIKKVKYSLSSDKQKVVDSAMSKAGVAQKAIIKNLFNIVSSNKESVDSLSANQAEIAKGNTIVILNKKDGKYYQLDNLSKSIKSASQVISGDVLGSKETKEEIAFRNDIDTLLNSIILKESIDVASTKTTTLNKEQAEKLYNELGTYIKLMEGNGDVVIPNVILHYLDTTGTNIASKTDLVIITKAGKLKIIDIQTGYDKEVTLTEGSILKNKVGIKKLPAQTRQAIKSNLNRRMLENMGYEFEDSDTAVTTYNVELINGELKIQDPVAHPMGQNLPYVNAIVKRNTDKKAKNKIQEARRESVDYPIMEDADYNDAVAAADQNDRIDDAGGVEYEILFKGIENFQADMIKRVEVLKTVKGAISMDKTKEDTIVRLNLAITMATEALRSGDGLSASKVYTEFLQQSLREVEKLEKYLIDKNNLGDVNFIQVARNTQAFADSFDGLTAVSATYGNLNSSQIKLKDKLGLTLKRVAGKNNRNNVPSIADQAIIDHVKFITKNETTRDFTDAEFEMLFQEAEKISGATLNFTDINTSKDTLLALMKKLWHQKREESLDRIGEREEKIIAAGAYLRKLSPGKNDKEIFEFIIETDKDGNHTGRYVVELGQKYTDLYDALYNETVDGDGVPLQYKEILDVKTADKADIAFNKDLYYKKKAFSAFKSPETPAGMFGLTPTDGDFHKFTEEWKEIRSQYQEYLPLGDFGIWEFKAGITDEQIAEFQAKYGNTVIYNSPVLIDGVPTGMVAEKRNWFPDKKFTEARPITVVDGKTIDLRSDKYRAIMEADPNDALAMARKSFYLVVKEQYENGMLKQLPENVRDFMLGKTPRVQGKLMTQLSKNPNVVTSYVARQKQSMKDFFTETTRLSRVNVDENGEVIDSLPIMFVGSLKDEAAVEKIQQDIVDLKQDYADDKIGSSEFESALRVLQSKEIALRSKPKAEELSWDVVSTMLKFSVMAQTYESMTSIEDTLLAFVKVIEDRKYKEPAKSKYKKMISAKFSSTFGKKGNDVEALAPGKDSNNAKHARAFMNMVFYNNAEVTKGMVEKAVDKLLAYSSLSYVGFNVFGNFNNYVLGRINNGIEMMGQRFFSRDAYMRASKEFNKRALQDMWNRTAHAVAKKTTGTKYDPYQPISKYEAFVDLFRMMDSSSDIREQGQQGDYVSYFQRFANVGYVFQDAAEYNVQTKVGMALLMDTYILNPATGELSTLFDAFDFDDANQKLVMKEGFTTMVKIKKDVPTFGKMFKGNISAKDAGGNLIYTETGSFTDKVRYDIRMKIREVNKQIHGNYAHEDRMVIQVHTWGKLLAQFHKWVVPAIRARYQKRYYDENLGWMEGRYNSWANFVLYFVKNVAKNKEKEKSMMQSWMESSTKGGKGFKNDGSQNDEKFINAALNVHRTNAELAILISILTIISTLRGIWEDDDDDSDLVKRLKNLSLYQATRARDELQLFIPLLGMSDALAFFESPFAATKALGEFGNVMDKTWDLGTAGLRYAITGNDEDWYGNKDVYYQRGYRADQMKIKKEIMDIVPILYEIKKWEDMIQTRSFYIGD